jgi:hypothetical protein
MRQDIVLQGCAPIGPGTGHGWNLTSRGANLNDARPLLQANAVTGFGGKGKALVLRERGFARI